jgi:hypothetical protein
MKYLAYTDQVHSQYFWRTYSGTELDYVEERTGNLYGYEFKWGNKQTKAPASWTETYTNSQYAGVNRENFLDFIAGSERVYSSLEASEDHTSI